MVSDLSCLLSIFQAVSAAPSFSFDGSNVFVANEPGTDVNEIIKELRGLIKCIDGAYVELIPEYKQMKKYYAEYQLLAKETNYLLDECERSKSPDLKKQ